MADEDFDAVSEEIKERRQRASAGRIEHESIAD